MNLKSNIASLYMLRFLNQVIPLISMPYIVRVVGPESFGRYAFAAALMGYLILIADYGFNLTATRDVSLAQKHKKSVVPVYSAVLALKFSILALQFIVLSICLWVMRVHDYWLFIFAFLFMMSQTSFPTFLFQGIGEMKWIIILNIVGKLLTVCMTLWLVNSPDDVELIPLIAAVFGGLSFLSAVGIIRFVYGISFELPKKSVLLSQLKSGLHVFLSNLYGGLYAGAGVVILGFYGNNVAAANYSLAEKLLQVMKGAYLPLIQALFPWFSRLISREDRSVDALLLKKLGVFVIVLILGSIIAWSIREEIVMLLFGEGYTLVASVFALLIFIPVIDFIRNVSGVLFLVNMGKERITRKITEMGALIGLAMIACLSYLEGAVGAAYGLLMTEILIAFSLTIITSRIIKVVRL